MADPKETEGTVNEDEQAIDTVVGDILANPEPPEGYKPDPDPDPDLDDLDPEAALEALENPPDPDPKPDPKPSPAPSPTPTPEPKLAPEEEPVPVPTTPTTPTTPDPAADPTDELDPTQFNERERGLYAAKQRNRDKFRAAEAENAALKAKIAAMDRPLPTPPVAAPPAAPAEPSGPPVNPLEALAPDDIPTRKQTEEYGQYQIEMLRYENQQQQQEQTQAVQDFLVATDMAGNDLYDDYEGVLTAEVAGEIRQDPASFQKIMSARTPAGAAKMAYTLAKAKAAAVPNTPDPAPVVGRAAPPPTGMRTQTLPANTAPAPADNLNDYQVDRLAAAIMQLDDPAQIDHLLSQIRGGG